MSTIRSYSLLNYSLLNNKEKQFKGAIAPFFVFFLMFLPFYLKAFSYASLESEYHKGNYKTIIRLESEILTLKDESLIPLAKAYLGVYDLDHSEKLLFLFINNTKGQNKIEGYLLLLDIYVKRRDLAKCYQLIKEVDSLIDKYPSEKLMPYYHLMKGKVFSYSNEELSYKHLNLALEAFPKNNSDIFSLYSWIIDSYLSENRLNEAYLLLSEAVELHEKSFYQNDYILIPIMIEKALFFHYSERFLDAIAFFEQKVLNKLQSQHKRFITFYKCEYFRLASLSYYSIGDYNKSIRLLHNYIKLTPNLVGKSYFRLGESYESLSDQYSVLGKKELSILYLKKAITIYKQVGRDRDVVRSNYLLSLLNARRKSYSSALNYLDEILFNNNYDDHFINNYRTIAHAQKLNYLISNLEINKFFNHYEKFTLNQSESFGDLPYLKIIIYKSYFRALVLSRKPRKNIHNFIQKIKFEIIDNELVKEEFLIDFYNLFILFYINDDDYENAETIIKKTLPIVEKLFEKESYLQTYSLISIGIRNYYLAAFLNLKLYQETSNSKYVDSGLIELKKGLEAYDRFKKTYKSQYDVVEVQKLSIELINLFMKFQFEEIEKNRTSLTSIFKHTQLSKSSQLLETLNRNLALQQSNIPDSLTIQLSSLKQQSSYLNTQINRLDNKEELSESDSTRLSDFRSVLLDNKVTLNDLMLYLENTFPKYYEINYNPPIATIEDVQNKLGDNEALIEYFVGNDHTYAFTISRDTATVHQLAKVSDSTINRFREVVIPKGLNQNMDVTYRQFIEQSHQLYQQLLAKPLQVLGDGSSLINKLYIIPDKSLNYLAFDLLLSEGIEKDRFVEYGKLPYLIKNYKVSYDYSASILFKEDSLRTDLPFNGKVLAFAPSYEKLLADTSKLNELGQFRNSLSPLKYNTSEVEGISGYFDTEVYEGNNATEKKFMESFQGNDIIHLAMHGLVDSKDSEKSRLVFTPADDSVHDNYLHNFELYNLSIDAKMAVLSACNTGYGKLEEGEGVMSLARAFTYAGSESVVMSQWPADDEASSVIMQSFYKYLSDGKRKDDALRLAKLDYLEQANPGKRNPFYWNNFVVMGDVSPLVKDQSSLYLYISLITVGMLLMVAFGIRYFTKRRV